MAKMKIKKNDVWIDMTPMSDVMVLLLTFFMLSANFVKNEVVKVMTPQSRTEVKVPSTATLDITIDTLGRVYLGTDKVVTMEYALDTLLSKEFSKYKDQLGDTKANAAIRATFKAETQIGIPFEQLAAYLGKTHEQMSKQLKESGLPLDSVIEIPNPNKETGKDIYSEFQLWVKALKNGYKKWYKDMERKKDKGEPIEIDLATTPNKLEICIKCDQNTPYGTFKKVITELQDINESRYKLLTQYKKEE
ncbi:MAG: biopolymer transporter ExbD [Prevotella sp.]|jgi:biopolymer transport protein ExbD|nr:biopolymer transporter ExbD [Prevotella sp.]